MLGYLFIQNRSIKFRMWKYSFMKGLLEEFWVRSFSSGNFKMSAMHGNVIIMCEHHQISQDLTKYHQLSPTMHSNVIIMSEHHQFMRLLNLVNQNRHVWLLFNCSVATPTITLGRYPKISLRLVIGQCSTRSTTTDKCGHFFWRKTFCDQMGQVGHASHTSHKEIEPHGMSQEFYRASIQQSGVKQAKDALSPSSK